MDTLDLQSILRRNPKIDAEEINEFLEDAKTVGNERYRPSSSPYDGRRMMIDEREEVRVPQKKRLSRYAKA